MFSIHFSGQSAILLRFKQEISREINLQVRNVQDKILESIAKNEILGIEEVISAYASLLICFNPRVINSAKKLESLFRFLESINLNMLPLLDNKKTSTHSQEATKCMIIPLCYDDEFGLDIKFVCENAKISKDELIKIHTAPHYFVYMLGFMAGFPYLGGLDPRLFTPRLAFPRLKVESGSVGIADKQTGIYPIESPGGWQIIARSPLSFFNRFDEANPVLLKANMFIKFRSIDKYEFYKIEKMVLQNAYKCEVFEYFAI